MPGRKHGLGRLLSENYEQYPFPLEGNRLAYLHVPGGKLTEREASRMKAFIDSLVIHDATNPGYRATNEEPLP